MSFLWISLSNFPLFRTQLASYMGLPQSFQSAHPQPTSQPHSLYAEVTTKHCPLSPQNETSPNGGPNPLQGEVGNVTDAFSDRSSRILAHLWKVLENEVEYDQIYLKYPSMVPCPRLDVDESIYEPYYRSNRSKFFWTLWSSLAPHVPSSELYSKALEHGARVTHRVLVDTARAKLPHRVNPPLCPLSTPAMFQISTDIGVYNDNYMQSVEQLLSRPNARGFLERGGLAWRLALQFGGESLWKDVFKGPSSVCVNLGIGERSPDHAYISEELHQNECDILTGSIYGPGDEPGTRKLKQSLFPPLDLFEQSKHWIGVWTIHNEGWFQGLLKLLRKKELKPVSQSVWVRNMRSNRKTLSEEDARTHMAIIQHLVA
jgi:hypothetical protein